MRPLRHPLVLRVLASVLLVGIGAACVPTASAQDARPERLRSLLTDADAFEAALQASRSAEGDGVEVFVAVYAEASQDAVMAEAVRQLLSGHGVGSVAPVLPDLSFVPAPAATSPSGHASAAVLGVLAPAGTLAQTDAADVPAFRAERGGAAHAVWARGP